MLNVELGRESSRSAVQIRMSVHIRFLKIYLRE